MKNKLTKNHRTKFDYHMRKLGLVSALLMTTAFACILPISMEVEKESRLLNRNVEILMRQSRNEPKEMKRSSLTIEHMEYQAYER
ncbi:unknown [Coprobacillus sp. CAG:826]|nr:unknown [Coprobacillus sp. CAG:826]